LSAATTLEKTLAIWLPIVKRTTSVMIPTRTRMPPNAATVTITAVLLPPPRAGPNGRAGSHARPFQRHIPSGETAGRHWLPSHHHKPSGEKAVRGSGPEGSPIR